MKIDVYDSFATSPTRGVMHFDVFVESGSSPELAHQYGQRWLESIGESAASLSQSRCNFCHSEMANPEVKTTIQAQRYFILQMEGCPANVG